MRPASVARQCGPPGSGGRECVCVPRSDSIAHLRRSPARAERATLLDAVRPAECGPPGSGGLECVCVPRSDSIAHLQTSPARAERATLLDAVRPASVARRAPAGGSASASHAQVRSPIPKPRPLEPSGPHFLTQCGPPVWPAGLRRAGVRLRPTLRFDRTFATLARPSRAGHTGSQTREHYKQYSGGPGTFQTNSPKKSHLAHRLAAVFL